MWNWSGRGSREPKEMISLHVQGDDQSRGNGAVDMGTPGSFRGPGFRRQVAADKGGLCLQT